MLKLRLRFCHAIAIFAMKFDLFIVPVANMCSRFFYLAESNKILSSACGCLIITHNSVNSNAGGEHSGTRPTTNTTAGKAEMVGRQ